MVQAGDSTVSTAGQTPIPGLRVEVLSEKQTTPIAVFTVVTDREGKPASTIIVDSSSEVTIQSVDESIARFAASGPASEFASPLSPAIVATPMIQQAEACIVQIEGTPVVQFKYNNVNATGASVAVPITALHPDLYRTPGVREDDLLLNSIHYDNTDVAPEAVYRAPAPNETSQLFTAGQGGFTVPYDIGAGALTWSFIGADLVVDGSTALCQDAGFIGCARVSPKLIRAMVSALRASVSDALRTAVRFARGTRSPLLDTGSRAIREMLAQANALSSSYICTNYAVFPSTCRRAKISPTEILKIHARIYSPRSLSRQQAFQRLRTKYAARLRDILKSLPSEVVVCSE